MGEKKWGKKLKTNIRMELQANKGRVGGPRFGVSVWVGGQML